MSLDGKTETAFADFCLPRRQTLRNGDWNERKVACIQAEMEGTLADVLFLLLFAFLVLLYFYRTLFPEIRTGFGIVFTEGTIGIFVQCINYCGHCLHLPAL